MTDKVVNAILRYSLDKPALNNTLAGTASLEKKLTAVEDQTLDVNAAAKKTGDSLDKSFTSASKSADKLAKSMEKVNRQQKQDKGDSGVDRVGAASTAFGALGALGGDGFSLIGDITGAGESLGQFATSITGVESSLSATLAVAAPTALAVGAVALAMENFKNVTKEATILLTGILNTQEEYHRFITDATRQQLEDRIAAAEKEKALLTRIYEENRYIVEQTIGMSLDDDRSGSARFGVRSTGNAAFIAAEQAMDSYYQKLTDQGILLGRLEGDLLSNATATNDMAAAERALAAERVAGYTRDVQLYTQFNNLVRTGSSEQIKNRLASIEDERKAIESVLEQIRFMQDNSAEAQAKVAELNNRLMELGVESDQLSKDIMKVVLAREGLTEFFTGIRKGVQTISDAVSETSSTFSKYKDDITKIEEQSGQRRVQIADRYAQAVEDATRSAVEAAEKSLRDLRNANADALREAGRESAAVDREFANEQFKVQIESRRAERDALVNHLRRLQDIRNSYADQEYEAGFNRDFANLFLIQRRRNAELAQAGTEFGRGISDRSTERADAQADAERDRQFERQERAIALSQKLEDLRIGYQRELQEAELARQQSLARARQVRQQELNELSQTLQRELSLRRQALQQELSLISQGASARLRIEGQTLSNVVRTASQIGSAISTIFGSLFGVKRGAGKASGGGVYPGFAYPVNEPWSSGMESITAGGRTYPLPMTPGMFIPTQPGTVNANRTPSTVNLSIVVNESKTPQMTAQAVRTIAAQEILSSMGIKR